jgi:hypothetical protein
MDASLRLACVALLGVLSFGCAEGTVQFQGDGGSGGTPSQGGAGPATGGTGGASVGGQGGSGGELPCGIDCSAITAPPCLQSVCNEGMYEGSVGSCVVVPQEAGAACEDGAFCTVSDTCDGSGQCVGGPQNDCGVVPAACETVVCDEPSQACDTVPVANGGICTPTDLCVVNAHCQNGLCIGQPKDCFFAPVPNECHASVCNSMNGQCEPQPNPAASGMVCNDPSDLCTVNKTCDTMGNCQGGSPKDCSMFTQGCNLGQCDAMTGQCFGMPINDGDPCDDLDSCTAGETCQMGSCSNGTPIVQCVGADNCCPMGCTEATDSDCSCNVNLATQAIPSSNGGGQNATGYGPNNWNDGIDEIECQTLENCTQCMGWISNSMTPNGAFMQYDWPSLVTIGSMYVDAGACPPNNTCYSGRTLHAGSIEYWDGVQWVVAQTFSNNPGDLAVTFNPQITTTKLRMFNVVAANCGQNNNTLAYEWYVWPGSGCMP